MATSATSAAKHRVRHQPKFYLLDRRADQIASVAVGADPDQLLNTREAADWLGVSTAWLEVGRSQKYGPPFRKLSPKLVRYCVRDLIAWLETRKHFAEKQGAR
jgi:predicted DNA-binding transcriptional regulator AlpA